MANSPRTSKSLYFQGVTLPVPTQDEERKFNLDFYFHTLWCFKRFHEGLKGFKNLLRHHKEMRE